MCTETMHRAQPDKASEMVVFAAQPLSNWKFQAKNAM